MPAIHTQRRRTRLRRAAVLLAVAFTLTGCSSGGPRVVVADSTASARPASNGSVTAGSATAGSAEAAPPSAPHEATGRWARIPAAPLDGITWSTGVWDGDELLIIGVRDGSAPKGAAVSAAYRPSTRSWRRLPAPPRGKPGQEGAARVVWTGAEMIVIGAGFGCAYNPASDRWRQLTGPSDLTARGDAALVWTGDRVLLWGGAETAETGRGWSYDPVANTWTPLPTAPVADGRATSGVWTGSQLIVAGGMFSAFGSGIGTGALAYTPATRAWQVLPPMPEPRSSTAIAWDGHEVIVIGGETGDTTVAQAQLGYDPATHRWRTLPQGEGPSAGSRVGHGAVWTGRQILVWGGGQFPKRPDRAGFVAAPSGTSYDPGTDSWTPLPLSPLQGRDAPVVAWTGSVLLVWGGWVTTDGSGRIANDGAAYTP